MTRTTDMGTSRRAPDVSLEWGPQRGTGRIQRKWHVFPNRPNAYIPRDAYRATRLARRRRGPRRASSSRRRTSGSPPGVVGDHLRTHSAQLGARRVGLVLRVAPDELDIPGPPVTSPTEPDQARRGASFATPTFGARSIKHHACPNWRHLPMQARHSIDGTGGRSTGGTLGVTRRGGCLFSDLV
jgi:hypothetical protein